MNKMHAYESFIVVTVIEYSTYICEVHVHVYKIIISIIMLLIIIYK